MSAVDEVEVLVQLRRREDEVLDELRRRDIERLKTGTFSIEVEEALEELEDPIALAYYARSDRDSRPDRRASPDGAPISMQVALAECLDNILDDLGARAMGCNGSAWRLANQGRSKSSHD